MIKGLCNICESHIILPKMIRVVKRAIKIRFNILTLQEEGKTWEIHLGTRFRVKVLSPAHIQLSMY